MIIAKILNNNAVIVQDQDGNEKILLGCGLAFGQKVGSKIDDAKVQKEFVLKQEISSRFQQFIKDIPMETVLLSEKIIAMAKEKSSRQLDDSIYVTLTDHIDCALQRTKSGIDVANPLTSAIINFYPEEYGIGLEAVSIIKNETGIQLSKDEAAFITMHIVTAQLGTNAVDFKNVAGFVMDISNKVRGNLPREVNEESTSWQRFLTHLAFFAKRIMSGMEQTSKEEMLFDTVTKAYPDAYENVKQLCDYIQKSYGFNIEKDERTYLTIHVNRLQQEFGKL